MIQCSNGTIIQVMAVTLYEAETKSDVDEFVLAVVLSLLFESFFLLLIILTLSVVIHKFVWSTSLVIYSVVVDSVVVISVVEASVVVASVTVLLVVAVFTT